MNTQLFYNIFWGKAIVIYKFSQKIAQKTRFSGIFPTITPTGTKQKRTNWVNSRIRALYKESFLWNKD